jgi:hypothetical protein
VAPVFVGVVIMLLITGAAVLVVVSAWALAPATSKLPVKMIAAAPKSATSCEVKLREVFIL